MLVSRRRFVWVLLMESNHTPEIDAAQKHVLECLLKAGWLQRFAESKTGVMLQWTDEGLDKLASLNTLLVEIGAENWTPTQERIGFLILYLAQIAELDENNVTLLGSLTKREPPS